MALADKAMLATLKTKAWEAVKYDKKATAAIHAANNAAGDTGRYTKHLLGKGSPLALVHSAKDGAGKIHRSMTAPWIDKGPRILPVTAYLDHGKAMQAAKQVFDDAVAAFLPVYPQLRDEQKVRQGGLWRASDWPDPASMPDRFLFHVELVELGSGAADWRFAISEAEAERLKAAMAETERTLLTQTQNAGWQKFHKLVAKLNERLTAYGEDKDGKVHGIFRDTLVDNLREMIDILPHFNVTDDPVYGKLIDEARAKLIVADAQDLRDFPGIRQRVAASAQEIQEQVEAQMKTMGDFGYGSPEELGL